MTWRDDFDAFHALMRERLEMGAREYGNRSFGLPPGQIGGELEEEAADIAVWGFILWQRIRRLRERV